MRVLLAGECFPEFAIFAFVHESASFVGRSFRSSTETSMFLSVQRTHEPLRMIAGTATDWQQDDGTTASRPSSVNVFGDPKAILRQSATFEHKLRDRMVPVVHNIENILRCFQDVDMKKAKTVSERAVGVQRFPLSRYLFLPNTNVRLRLIEMLVNRSP